MRKGFSLIEMLVVLSLLALLSPVFAKLTFAIINDVPKSYNILDDNSRILNILETIKNDIEKGNGLPDSFEKFKAGTNVLLIDSAQGVICYQLNDKQLIRQTINKDQQITNKWELGKGKISWRILNDQGINYAVEIENYVEQNTSKGLEKKMTNNHVYFAGLLPGEVK